MMEFYSIRMRAAQQDEHISGAERLVPKSDIALIVNAMIERALQHPRGTPESIRLAVDLLPDAVLRSAPLPAITTVRVKSVAEGRLAARHELLRAGVTPQAADRAISALADGAAPGGRVMRGAMLVDAASGNRLENDPSRGVRVSRMDMTPDTRKKLVAALPPHLRQSLHLQEALVLAGKVLLSPGIVAELCWSDDPNYQAGYVASPDRGYIRFPYLKEKGDRLGGRAFFYDPDKFDLQQVTDFLQQQPVLFNAAGPLYEDEEFQQ